MASGSETVEDFIRPLPDVCSAGRRQGLGYPGAFREHLDRTSDGALVRLEMPDSGVDGTNERLDIGDDLVTVSGHSDVLIGGYPQFLDW